MAVGSRLCGPWVASLRLGGFWCLLGPASDCCALRDWDCCWCFLLSWAAGVAQFDVSASLAIAMLALIAILPEYSIEAVLAWKAGALGSGTDIVTPEMARVTANVTGTNRLLIGVGW